MNVGERRKKLVAPFSLICELLTNISVQCDPENRVWPAKCQLCITKNRPCSEPMLANGLLLENKEISTEQPLDSPRVPLPLVASEAESKPHWLSESSAPYREAFLFQLTQAVPAYLRENSGRTLDDLKVLEIATAALEQFECRSRTQGGNDFYRRWFEHINLQEIEDAVKESLEQKPRDLSDCHILEAVIEALSYLLQKLKKELPWCPVCMLWWSKSVCVND
jgi:hypothetical protein